MTEFFDNTLSKTIIIPNLFYFGVPKNRNNNANLIIFQSNKYNYERKRRDYGPLDIGLVYQYIQTIEKLLKSCLLSNKKLLHLTHLEDKERLTNDAYLIASFQIIFMKCSVFDAYTKIALYAQYFQPYKDASYDNPFSVTDLRDALYGLFKAQKSNIFNYYSFKFVEYNHYSKLENGDINWIIPNRMLAFPGPEQSCEYEPVRSLECYIPFFIKNQVDCVIQLNEELYKISKLKWHCIQHYELIFEDGDVPDHKIVRKFMKICARHSNSIAIHCHAGLGRTGTLIAYYLMSFYKFTAKEAISWIRICRPGSIIGIQQYWLIEKQSECWKNNKFINPISKYKKKFKSIYKFKKWHCYLKMSSLSRSIFNRKI